MEKEKKKRIRLVIADNMFTLLTSDNEEYSKQLAATLDSEIKEICRTCGKPVTVSAILVALNSSRQVQPTCAVSFSAIFRKSPKRTTSSNSCAPKTAGSKQKTPSTAPA